MKLSYVRKSFFPTEHLSFENDDDIVHCIHCKSDITMAALLTHCYSCGRRSRKKPLSKKNFVCFACNYACRHTYRILAHVRTHTKEKPHPCTMCNYRSGTTTGLRSHLLSAHIVVAPCDEKKFRCTLCNFQTTNIQYVKHHVKNIHINNFEQKPRQFSCFHCTYITNCMKDMKLHNESVHLNPRGAMEQVDLFPGHPMMDDPLFDVSRLQMALDTGHCTSSMCNSESNLKNTETLPVEMNHQDVKNTIGNTNFSHLENRITQGVDSQDTQNSIDEANRPNYEWNSEDFKYPICELNSENTQESISELNSQNVQEPISELNFEVKTEDMIGEQDSDTTGISEISESSLEVTGKDPICKLEFDVIKKDSQSKLILEADTKSPFTPEEILLPYD